MALDATVGGSASNSYVTEATANSYLTGERLYITAWTSATTPQREQALIWATFLLDVSFEYLGYKSTLAQALRWPRAGIIDADGYALDSVSIPSLVQKATATLALSLLSSDRTAEPALLGLGISEAKVGPLSATITDLAVKELVPEDVQALLLPFGTLKAGASKGSATVKLWRA
jgi:hypothetical protein